MRPFSLSRFLMRAAGSSPRPSRRPRSATTRLRVEALEDRVVPAMVTWINPAGGDWDTASNWLNTTTGLNQVPTASDDAVIDIPGITVTHTSFFNSDTVNSLTSDATVSVSNGSLTINNSSTTQTLIVSGGTVTAGAGSNLEVGTLTQSGGTIDGAGAVTVATALLWTGGTMSDTSGSGVTNIEGTGEIGGSSPFGPTLSGRMLDNFGTTTVDSGSNLLFSSQAVLNNEVGGTLVVQGGASLGNFFGSSGSLSNAGTLTGSDLAGTTSTLDIAVDNTSTGTINVASGTTLSAAGLTNEGTLVLSPGALATISGGNSSGDFQLQAGSQLNIGGTFTLLGSSTTEVASGGDLELDGTVTQQAGASVTLASGSVLEVGPNFSFGSQNYILSDGAAVTGAGSVVLSGGSSLMTVDGTATLSNLDVSNGTVTASAGSNLEVDALTQSGGTINGAGAVTVNTSLLWTGGTMSDTSGTGVTNIEGTGEIGGGSPFGPSLNGRMLDNFGTTTVDSGSNLLFSNQGMFNNEAGAELVVQGGASLGNFFGSSGSLSNAGTLTGSALPGATATVSISVDNTSTGTISAASGTLSLADGLTNDGTLVVKPGALATVTGGSNSGIFHLTAGSQLNIAGTFTLLTGSTTSVGLGSDLELDGTVTQQAGAAVTLASGSVLEVGPNFSFGSQNYILSDGAAVTGAGSVVLSGGSSLMTVDGAATLNNLDVSNGTVTASAGSNLSVNTLTQSGGTINGAGAITVNTSLLWTGGTMSDTTGTGVTNIEGTGEIGGGSPFGPSLSGRMLDNFGTTTVVSGSNLLFSNQGVFNNEIGAELVVQGGASLGNFFGSSGSLSNAGTLTESGLPSTTATLDIPVNNTGTISVTAGATLSAADGLTNEGTLIVKPGGSATVTGGNNSGIFRLTAGSQLDLAGTFTLLTGSTTSVGLGSDLELDGTVTQQAGAAVTLASGSVLEVGPNFSFGSQNYILADGAAVSGAGSVVLSGGSSLMTVDGTATLKNLDVSNGTVTASASSNLEVSNLTQSGGTITGLGTVIINNVWNWTGGTMSGTGLTLNEGTAALGNNPFGVSLSQRTIDNNGTVTLTAGDSISFSNSAVFDNLVGGTLSLGDNSSLGSFFGNGGSLSNAGTLVRSGTSGITATVDVPFDNTGKISVQTGTLSAADGLTNEGTLVVSSGALGTVTGGDNSGIFHLAAGGQLDLAGTFTLLTGSSNSVGLGGDLELDGTVTQQAGASVTLASGSVLEVGPNFSFGGQNYILADGASVTGAGTVVLSGGSSLMTVDGAATLKNLDVSNGTVTASAGSDLTVDNLTQSGGTIDGAGTVTVNTALVWTGGTMSDTTGTGVTNVDGTAEIGGGNPFGPTLSGRMLDNFGTTTLDSGSNLLFANQADFNNEDGAQLVLQSSSSLGNFFGNSGSLNNEGTLSDTGPTSHASVQLSSGITNSGTISLQGVLTVSGPVTQTADGNLTIVFSATGTNGELEANGQVTLNGTLNVQTPAGFAPTLGQVFTILTGSAISGDFSAFTGLNLGNGLTLVPSNNTTSYTLTVAASS